MGFWENVMLGWHQASCHHKVVSLQTKASILKVAEWTDRKALGLR